jgi:hypothetical protein
MSPITTEAMKTMGRLENLRAFAIVPDVNDRELSKDCGVRYIYTLGNPTPADGNWKWEKEFADTLLPSASTCWINLLQCTTDQ